MTGLVRGVHLRENRRRTGRLEIASQFRYCSLHPSPIETVTLAFRGQMPLLKGYPAPRLGLQLKIHPAIINCF